jgi:hypothetical protein
MRACATLYASAIITRRHSRMCKAAFEKALFIYPQNHLELRHGARIILKSKEPLPKS